jgi:hypothetical protein
MVGIRTAKNYYSTSQRKRLVHQKKPMARELKGLLWVTIRPLLLAAIPASRTSHWRS